MKLWLVARKCILELLREPQLLALILVTPLFFMLITAVGYSSPRLATYRLAVYDPDGSGEALVEQIEAARYADGRPVFKITRVDDPQAVDRVLKDQTAALAVDFSQGDVGIRGDATSMAFTRASLALENLLGTALAEQSGEPQWIRVEEQALDASGAQTEFDAYAPGMMIFAILLIIPQTAMILGRELRWGTLRRLRLTPLKTWELLGGVSLSQMAIAVAQVSVLFLAALVMGFHNRGSLLLAIGLGLILSFSAIGMGFVVAGFSHKDSDALNTGSVFTMLQVFISGAFFPMPSEPLFKIAGHGLGFFDLIPATHGMLALQQVLSGGAGWSQVAFRATAMLLLSLVYFGVGAWVFRRFHMRADGRRSGRCIRLC